MTLPAPRFRHERDWRSFRIIDAHGVVPDSWAAEYDDAARMTHRLNWRYDPFYRNGTAGMMNERRWPAFNPGTGKHE